jgi:hypothetical protein
MRGIRTAPNTDQPICDLPITMLVSTHDVKLVDELTRSIVADEGTKKILSDEKFLIEHGLEKPRNYKSPSRSRGTLF